ncbi:WD40 repeat domain-containing protein [Patescibacteria group bacterium]|nr:WD40 repeat domain-containing protein [Patescibacteria group bacterium]
MALSDDGKYLAAKTSRHVYFFDLNNTKEPKWVYTHDQNNEIGGDLKGGIAISEDGSKIIASIAESTLFFDSSSNKPLWRYNHVGNAYNVAISKDGKYMAAGTGGTESNTNSNLLILWNEKSEKPLWQYHSSGNFHDVSLSSDGKFVVGATGCPDRRFYVFSRDSNTPLIQSEMLTRDSPVHRAKISADGTLAAIGSESDAGAVFLFKTDSKEPVWKFPTQNGSSVRALNFTPDGKFIGAATFGGQAYIFEKDKSSPVATWVVNNTALGGVDISDDGSFIAAGGTDKKLHLFEKGNEVGKEISFDEYVEEIDISGNGKYIAAGTGGSVYFFESINSSGKTFPCTTVIEPKPRNDTMGGDGTGQKAATSLCGDGKCEGPEAIDNCKQDCDPNFKTTRGKLPGMLFGFGFLGFALLLGLFTAVRKLKFLESQKKILTQFNISKLSFLKLTGKKVTIALIILTTLFLILTITTVLFNKNPDAKLLKQGEQTKPASGKVIKNENKDGVINRGKTESGCGNTICEPGLGETKESCPKDCSGGD